MHIVPAISTHITGACLATAVNTFEPAKNAVASTTCPRIVRPLVRVTQRAWTLSSGATRGFSNDAA
jgi:hypothetical protein